MLTNQKRLSPTIQMSIGVEHKLYPTATDSPTPNSLTIILDDKGRAFWLDGWDKKDGFTRFIHRPSPSVSNAQVP
jgi:hypothetical protein